MTVAAQFNFIHRGVKFGVYAWPSGAIGYVIYVGRGVVPYQSELAYRDLYLDEVLINTAYERAEYAARAFIDAHRLYEAPRFLDTSKGA